MEIVASLLVFAALGTIMAALIFVVRAGWRTMSRTTPPVVRRHDEQPPAFGSLPTLGAPVGPLGEPAPDTDLSSDASSEREIYGE